MSRAIFTRVSSRAVACTIVLAAACGGQQSNEPPVATPSLTLGRDRAAIGSPLKLTYRFEVAPNARIQQDHWVFVHVLDPEGERLWGDDHQPPEPTSKWQPGQKIEYTRTVFVPNYPYIGPAHIRVGLYHPPSGKRLPLSGNEVARQEYEVARFQLLPQSENVFLIYKEGWHSPEVSSDDPSTEWQWTRKAAAISFRNPKKDSTLYLEYDARIDKFDPPQQVTVRLGDHIVGSFAASSKEKALVSFLITAAQLGQSEMSELIVEVDRTFVPGGSDVRELGIRLYHAFIEPR
jgi:hypothetical protein